MTVHVVSTGENLQSISDRYGMPVTTIIRVNGLSTTNIVPGLALYIPDNALPTRTYQFKTGDTIALIAQRFSADIPSITAANPEIDFNNIEAGRVINIPSTIKMAIRTLGFLVPSGSQSDLSTLTPLSNQLTYLAIVNYSFTEQGFAFAQNDDSSIIKRCKDLNIKPLLMIRNFTSSGFSAELAGGVLENETYRQNLVASIVNLTTSRGFSGVSLDLEFIPPERRNEFNLFLQKLKVQLGNLVLNVNVHAKREDLPTNRIVGAYDYASIGRTADIMAVMTIDYGYPGGPPDPISPITWTEQVVKYALSLVNPEKLMMAMALYGYDKVSGTNKTQALSVQAAQNKAISMGVPIEFDDKELSPWYRYREGAEEHIVWFEDIRSYIAKYKLMDIYKLAGTTFWQISLSAPQNWAYLYREITVIKNGI